MTLDWDDTEERQDGDDEEADVGFVGGGGPAETLEGDDDLLDEHGQNLREAEPGED